MTWFRPGLTIDDRYELDDLIGEGGYGVVYRAKQLTTGQFVAIKFLLKDRLETSEAQEIEAARFERETLLISKLKHPHIVRLLDSGAYEGKHPYMVLDLVEGESLFEVVQRDGPLQPEEAARIMFGVLDAIALAHDVGVIHRDMKPQNIMLTRGALHREPMVLDFGVAAIQEFARDVDYVSLTLQDEVQGTPAYISPEQLRQKPLTPQSDVYSWGLVFAEALTGERVVQGDTAMEVAMAQVADAENVLPASIRDPELRRIITKAIAKPLEIRYASAADALRELDRWIATQITSSAVNEAVKRDPPSESGKAPDIGRNMMVGAVIVGLLITAGIVAVVLSSSSNEDGEPAETSTPVCAESTDCADGESCVDGACIRATAEGHGCDLGPLVDRPEKSVVIGSIVRSQSPSGGARDAAIRLAIGELNDLGGLAGGKSVIHVPCDASSSADAVRAARVLTTEAGAAAIIGPSHSDAFIDVVTQVTREAGVITISFGATAAGVSTLSDDHLALRTVASDAKTGAALAELIPAVAPARVAVFARGDAYGSGLLNLLSESLATALKGRLEARTYDADADDLAAVVGPSAQVGTELVVVLGTDRAADVVEAFEAAAGHKRTRYLLSEAGRRPEVVALAVKEPSLVGRLEVVGAAETDPSVYAPFALRLAAKGAIPAGATKVATAYDATWTAIYLLAAGQGEVLQGDALVGAMRRLATGKRVDVGPTAAGAALASVSEGASIDLHGASGPLDFDPETGDVAASVLRWRLSPTLDGPPLFIPVGQYRSDGWNLTWVDLFGHFHTADLPLVRVAARAVTIGVEDGASLESGGERFRPGDGARQATSYNLARLDVMSGELTNGQWQRFSGRAPAIAEACADATVEPGELAEAPLVEVAPAEAQTFCAALGLRLPAADELEAIARIDDVGVVGIAGGVAEWATCSEEPKLRQCIDGFTVVGGGREDSWPAKGAERRSAPPKAKKDRRCARGPRIGFRCVGERMGAEE